MGLENFPTFRSTPMYANAFIKMNRNLFTIFWFRFSPRTVCIGSEIMCEKVCFHCKCIYIAYVTFANIFRFSFVYYYFSFLFGSIHILWNILLFFFSTFSLIVVVGAGAGRIFIWQLCAFRKHFPVIFFFCMSSLFCLCNNIHLRQMNKKSEKSAWCAVCASLAK